MYTVRYHAKRFCLFSTATHLATLPMDRTLLTLDKAPAPSPMPPPSTPECGPGSNNPEAVSQDKRKQISC